MRTLLIIIAGSLLMISTSCRPAQRFGPPGFDGRAFVGIDYDYQHPYSYWDDNTSVPANPHMGHYYATWPGLYHFEYFINPFQYWYGTYEIWINSGGPGLPGGERGMDGMDTYLMLICNPEGFYFDRFNSFKVAPEVVNGKLVYDGEAHGLNVRITMQKTSLKERAAQEPKFKLL